MEHDLHEKLFSWAVSLGYTADQYEEARKETGWSVDANQLLKELLKKRDTTRRVTTCSTKVEPDSQQANLNNQAINNATQDKDSGIFSNESTPSSSLFPSSDYSQQTTGLRKIFIDGSNVARSHGNGLFSWLGIKLCVDWFRARNHEVQVFVPSERCRTADNSILSYLHGILIECPSICNDDFFVIQAAMQNNGVIVSNDKFRDESRLSDAIRNYTTANRLSYVFSGDHFIPALDPLGRSGRFLEEFLREGSAHRALNKVMSIISYQRPKKMGYANNTPRFQGSRSVPNDRYQAAKPDGDPSYQEVAAKSQQPKNYENQRQLTRTNSNTSEHIVSVGRTGNKKSMCRMNSNRL